MIVSLIVAMDESRGIGLKGRLPWHLRADLKRFKQLTMGHYLIMGRKTYESLDRNLSGRTIVIVTRQKSFKHGESLVAHSLEQALNLARKSGESEAFVAGGGEIFSQALPFADRIYLTEVHTRVDCDVYFPDFPREQWIAKESISYPADDSNDYTFTFHVLEKKA
jgi:dihydrofolate reductase